MALTEGRTLGDLRPAAGESVRGMIRVPGVEPPWEMPAWVIRGAERGRTLVVTAGVRAAEYPPIEAAVRFARALDPRQLRGTVVVVSLVNLPGFFERSIYVNPRDGRNLNRAFPGAPDGAPSARVVNFLLEHVIRGADAYLDLHCGDLIEALEPFAMYRVTGDPDLDSRADRLARAYGLRHLIAAAGDDVPGSSTGAASQIGVPVRDRRGRPAGDHRRAVDAGSSERSRVCPAPGHAPRQAAVCAPGRGASRHRLASGLRPGAAHAHHPLRRGGPGGPTDRGVEISSESASRSCWHPTPVSSSSP